jgi:hypothetical protein
MTRRHTLPRAARSFAAALLLGLVFAAPAWASVSSEQQQGAHILNAIHAGTLKSARLSSFQYEQVGEYLMGRALGSTAAHERMNALMGEMMGPAAADQMHLYLGERYLGKTAQITGSYAPIYGLVGMMMSYRGSSLATMMSGYLGSHSERAGSATSGSGMMGTATETTAASTGWPIAAIAAIAILAALLIAGTLTLLLRRRPSTAT